MVAQQQRPIRVLCVDDDSILAGALRIAFKYTPQIAWAGHLSSANSLLDEVTGNCPDIILLDIRMPGKDPLKALEQVGDRCPTTRTIILSAFLDQNLIDQAIEAGAWGVVSKHETDPVLMAAIQRVAQGEFVLSDEAKAIHRANA